MKSTAVKLPSSAIFLFVFYGMIMFISETYKGYISAVSLLSFATFILVPLNKFANRSFGIFFVFILSYTFFGALSGFFSNIQFVFKALFPPIAFFLFGSYAMDKITNDKQILSFLFVAIFLFSLTIYLSIFYSIAISGSLVNRFRTFELLGDSTKSLSATLVGLSASIGMVGLPSFFTINNVKPSLKWAYLFLFICSLLTTIHLVNRTSLVVTIICLIIVMCYYFSKKPLNLLLTFIIVGIVVYLLLNYVNISEISSAYADRMEDLDNISTLGERSWRWQNSLVYLLKYPMGWWQSDSIRSHNMWLDFARVAGIVPFVLSILVAINSISTIIRICKLRKDSVSSVLLGLNVCFFISCFMEPIYPGTFMYSYCFLLGFQNRYLYKLTHAYW